jgi:hypothetical protein
MFGQTRTKKNLSSLHARDISYPILHRQLRQTSSKFGDTLPVWESSPPCVVKGVHEAVLPPIFHSAEVNKRSHPIKVPKDGIEINVFESEIIALAIAHVGKRKRKVLCSCSQPSSPNRPSNSTVSKANDARPSHEEAIVLPSSSLFLSPSSFFFFK